MNSLLFKPDMVLATLDELKTETRRIMKPQPYLGDGVMTLPNNQKVGIGIWYWEDEWWWSDIQTSLLEKCPYGKVGDHLIFMPKWASRITLQIVSIKVERIQDITPEGILAEGCPVEHRPENCNGMSHAAFEWFRHLWDSINLKLGYGWDDNPWVWVIKYKKVQGAE